VTWVARRSSLPRYARSASLVVPSLRSVTPRLAFGSMITIPLSTTPTSRLLKLPYWLDVTLSRIGSLDGSTEGRQRIQTLRLEMVPLLIVAAGLKAGMKTLGVPSEVGEVMSPEPFEAKGEMEEMMKKLVVDRLGKFTSDRPTLGHLTSVTFHGETSAISKWIGYLIGLNLSVAKEIATALEAASGITGLLPDAGEGFIPEILGDKPKDYDILDGVLTQPIHYYLIEWVGADSAIPEEDYIFEEPVLTKPPPILETSQIVTTSDFFTELVDSTISTSNTETQFDSKVKPDFLEIRDIIARINSVGESHRPIITNPGQKYATLEEMDNHIKRTRDHTLAVAGVTDTQRKMVLDYFSFIIGISFGKALAKVRAQNMDLAVERIEGYKPTRFMTTDLRRIKVVVRDPCPINSGKPSEHGVVVAITGLVTVER